MKLDNLQLAIVVFFGLTVLLSVGSLLMFFVEVPYKSTYECKEIHQKDKTINTDDNIIERDILQKGKLQRCTWTPSKEPSALFNGLVNANIVSGMIFICLSAYAYIKRPKKQTQPSKP